MDQPRLAVKLRLASQVADIHLERVRRRREVVSPNVVEDLIASEYLAGMKHEEFQQAELGAGQADRAVATAHLTGGWIKGEIPKGEPRLAGAVGRTPQQGARPGKRPLEGERFWQVVGGAPIQPRHPVRDRVASCEHEDRQVLACRTQASGWLPPGPAPAPPYQGQR